MTFVPFAVFESNFTDRFKWWLKSNMPSQCPPKRSKKVLHLVKVWKKPGALSHQLGPACKSFVVFVTCLTGGFHLRPELFKSRACCFHLKIEKLINSTCYTCVWLGLLPAYPSQCPIVRGPACPQQTVAFKAFLEQCEMLKVVTCFPQSQTLLGSFCHRGSHFKYTGLWWYMLHVVVGSF